MHLNAPPDPARRRTVVGGFDFHATVQMHCTFAVLIAAERFQRQRQQVRSLFGKHGGHLPFSSAVDARVGPASFPMIEVGLCFLQTLKPLSLERRFLSMADAGFALTFSIWVSHSTGHGPHAIVGHPITIELI